MNIQLNKKVLIASSRISETFWDAVSEEVSKFPDTDDVATYQVMISKSAVYQTITDFIMQFEKSYRAKQVSLLVDDIERIWDSLETLE